jgi:hypothetical protein
MGEFRLPRMRWRRGRPPATRIVALRDNAFQVDGKDLALSRNGAVVAKFRSGK